MKKYYKILKNIGAVYCPNVGWAIPDPKTGTCWFDNSSYNNTIFLGRNAIDAVIEIASLDIKEAENEKE